MPTNSWEWESEIECTAIYNQSSPSYENWVNYSYVSDIIQEQTCQEQTCKVKPLIVADSATQIEVKLMRKIIRKGGRYGKT
jgi:hypothetical protein